MLSVFVFFNFFFIVNLVWNLYMIKFLIQNYFWQVLFLLCEFLWRNTALLSLNLMNLSHYVFALAFLVCIYFETQVISWQIVDDLIWNLKKCMMFLVIVYWELILSTYLFGFKHFLYGTFTICKYFIFNITVWANMLWQLGWLNLYYKI